MPQMNYSHFAALPLDDAWRDVFTELKLYRKLWNAADLGFELQWNYIPGSDLKRNQVLSKIKM